MKIFKKIFPIFLFCYHLAFSYFAWKYILEHNGDAKKYWFVGRDLESISWFNFLEPGTDLIYFFTFPLVKFLQLPFWMGFVIFSIIGFLGFYLLWKLLLSISKENTTIILTGVTILLLPNAHFWTSLIGKESILFLSLCVIAIAIYRNQWKSWKLILSFVIVLLIRPHIAGLLLVSGLITFLFISKLNLKKKSIILFFGVILLCVTAFVLQNVAKGKGNLFQKISYLYEAHIRVLKKTDAYVPLDDYFFPYKIFTFYFRPLPWEKSDFFYQIVAWENLLALGFTLISGYYLIRFFKKIENKTAVFFSGIFIFIFATMYVFAYANYGLILRTKVMVFPFGFLFLIQILDGKFKSQKISNPKNIEF